MNLKTIGIFTVGKVEGYSSWDPDSIDQGIGGSEEAVIYMSQQLAKQYKVLVFGDPPPHSMHSHEQANPRYLPLFPLYKQPLDVAISWRMPDTANLLKRTAKKVYFWPHDVCYYKMSDEQIDAFDGVLWLSQWQRAQWCFENPSLAKFQTICGNGLEERQFEALSFEKKNPYSCIYGSNYGRGLSVLLTCWPLIKQQFPQATLDIYYGMKQWGKLPPEESRALQRMIDSCASLDVREHGLVSHNVLNQAYARTSFWTYPCTFSEVFCISALRAQLCGCIPVIVNYPPSALSETVRYGYQCTNPDEYFGTLVRAMKQAEYIRQEHRKEMGQFIRNEYTWKHVAKHWMKLFEQHVYTEAT